MGRASSFKMESFQLDAHAQQSVDAYVEYDRIVGNADGGKPFSDKEFAAFKQSVAQARRPENRLYVSYRCEVTGVDCKNVGPSARCFCGHLFKHHATDNYKDRNVHCREAGCRCNLFSLIPGHGSRYLKCRCKHDYDEHACTGSRKCKRCGSCPGFDPTQSCPCGQPHKDHSTVYESRAERQAQGRPVEGIGGSDGAGYAALGGLTDFSSLVDGCDRLDRVTDSAECLDGPRREAPRAISYSVVDQILQFYEERNPCKLQDGTAAKLLDQFQGREAELLKKLEKKYKKAPALAEWVDVTPASPEMPEISSQPANSQQDEMEFMHAKYDAKYGKPRQKR